MTNERTETHACDCISRRAAISVIAKWMLEYGGEGEERERIALKKAAEEINVLPSAQPERKTGRWLPDTRTFEMMFVCSECKASLHVDTINLKPSWDYCPYCGSFNGGENWESVR